MPKNEKKKQRFGIEIPITFRLFSIIRSVVRQITSFLQSLEDEIEDLRKELESLKKGVKK